MEPVLPVNKQKHLFNQLYYTPFLNAQQAVINLYKLHESILVMYVFVNKYK